MAPADSPSPAPSPNDQTGASGRDSRGRFAKGNPGVPGNPFAGRVAALRAALLRRATEADVAAVADRLLAKARKGDLAAAKLVLSYSLGPPAECVDPGSRSEGAPAMRQPAQPSPTAVNGAPGPGPSRHSRRLPAARRPLRAVTHGG